MHLQKIAGRVCLGVGVLALAVRLALLPVRPIPLPAVHDEFAYLLGAETFVMGRVTNPPHPMWVHFETFHELFEPTYAPKYPPAQAFILALGWKVFGHPWYGVWLSCGLMCAAFCWMLQGWLPPRYALLGGLMAVAQWGIVGVWIDSYMGGALAAGAGALVVGAVPRLARVPTAGVAALAAMGIAVLANTRPYEGGVTVVGAAIVLLIWRRRAGRLFRELLSRRVVLPAITILGCGLAAMLYYNYRVTGHALLMPYVLYQGQYGSAPIHWLMPPLPVRAYRHDVLRRFWMDVDKLAYDQARTWPPLFLTSFVGMFPFFMPPVSAAAAVTAIFLRASRKVRIVLIMAAFPIAAVLLERFALPAYFAPATAVVLLLVWQGVQYLRVHFGARAVVVFAVLLALNLAIQAAMRAPDIHQEFARNRQSVERQLASEGGRHLVLVRYGPEHNVFDEWVYNHADIDASTVVWGRDMGEARNRELVDYYRGRKVWLLEADRLPEAVTPYTW